MSFFENPYLLFVYIFLILIIIFKILFSPVNYHTKCKLSKRRQTEYFGDTCEYCGNY